MTDNTAAAAAAEAAAEPNDQKALFIKDGVVIGILMTSATFKNVLETHDTKLFVAPDYDVFKGWVYVDGVFTPPAI
jgi:hypothetical protein